MLISIIIPNYNREKYITDTIRSIQSQKHTDWECIIIDDGSTDDSYRKVKPYLEQDNRIQFHSRPDSYKKGGNGARNYGLHLSKGEYVQFLDSDDMLFSSYTLKDIVSKITQKVDVFLTNIVTSTTMTSDDFKIREFPDHDAIISELRIGCLLKKFQLQTSQPFWSREFLISENLKYDETLVKAQDFDFIIRCLSKIQSIKYYIGPSVILRIHNESISYKYHKKRSLDGVLSDFKVYIRHYYTAETLNVHKEYWLRHERKLRSDIYFMRLNKAYKETLISLWIYSKLLLKSDMGCISKFKILISSALVVFFKQGYKAFVLNAYKNR